MINRIEDFMHHHKILRRGTLALALWMTWQVSAWSMWFAVENSRNGVEIAAILAAIQAPITLCTSMIFKAFVDSKDAS